jgi:colanic acid biosynthesis glycosyl transferase WcaI
MFLQIFWRPDVVLMIEPTMFCAPHVLFVAMASGSSSWLHVQDFEIDAAFQLGGLSSRLKSLVHAIERFLMSKFDRVSTISDRMVERLCRKGVAQAKTALLPNWVDTSTIYPLGGNSNSLRGELGIADRSIVALYSGSMGTKQGLKLLVDASRRLAARSDIQFIFCGDGPYRETLLAEKRDNSIVLPLQSAGRFNELLNLADIHLLPQLSDASDLVMPSKLTGMMASGRPVVATAHPETQIAKVLDGKGLVVKPDSLDDFVCAITKLAEDAKLRNSMGHAARQHAVEHMDRSQILGRFEVSIREICSRTTMPEEDVAKKEELLPQGPAD